MQASERPWQLRAMAEGALWLVPEHGGLEPRFELPNRGTFVIGKKQNIQLVVKGRQGREMQVKIKKSTPLGKLMGAN